MERSRFVDNYYGNQIISNKCVPVEILEHILDTEDNCALSELQIEFKKNPGLKDAWLDASKLFYKNEDFIIKHVYSGNKKVYSKTRNEYNIALVTYALSGSFYREFNMASTKLLEASDWEKYSYKGFYYLMVHAFQVIPTSITLSSETCLYRGVKHGTIINEGVGTIVSFNHFVSTTTDINVAKKFLSEHGAGTLITIDRPPMFSKSIKYLSPYRDEEEVLIWPWCRFEVLRIDTCKNKNGISSKIHLTPVD